jgi:D-glycero-D-manno-heptose 1,7-bisphosphate phosphatase
MEGTHLNGARRPAVFLDRDGTLIEDVGYLSKPEQIRLLPGVPEALRKLREAGFLLIVTTNQSAIARGWLTEGKLHAVHESLNSRLRRVGAQLDAFYYCPHLPDGQIEQYAQRCDCRKPGDGMLRRAAREWRISLADSYAVGDSRRDVEAGRRAGCFAVLLDREAVAADACARDLAEAADIILQRHRSMRQDP